MELIFFDIAKSTNLVFEKLTETLKYFFPANQDMIGLLVDNSIGLQAYLQMLKTLPLNYHTPLISEKLSAVLEEFLSLHEADEIHNMILNDKFSREECLKFLNYCNSKEPTN